MEVGYWEKAQAEQEVQAVEVRVIPVAVAVAALVEFPVKRKLRGVHHPLLRAATTVAVTDTGLVAPPHLSWEQELFVLSGPEIRGNFHLHARQTNRGLN